MAVGFSLISGSVLRAHEIGTTRVSVLLEGGTYNIEIVTDAAALAEKLQASNTGSTVVDTHPDRLQALFLRFDETFRKRVKVAFDETDDHPQIDYSVEPATNAPSISVAVIRMTGAIPPEVHHLTWNYAWTFASYALMVRTSKSGNPTTEWLEGDQASTPFSLDRPAPIIGRAGTVWRYFKLGYTHILPNGVDHILFVLGIFLLNGRLRSILSQVSAFTLAHSITLGLSMYGVLAVSPKVVEPLIALSIAYVAIENIFLSELKSWRVALVFCFGLLHGMGFAGALKELALPRSEFLTALVTFNVGVEVGQLSVIAAAFMFVGWYCGKRSWYRSRVVIPASALMACTAVYWVIQRLSL
jgi:hypothetical protein